MSRELTDDDIWRFWWARPGVPDGEDDSMEAEFVAAARAAIAADRALAASSREGARQHDELSRDPDGDISMDWQTAEGDMLSMSLSSEGRLAVAVTEHRGEMHGTVSTTVWIPPVAFDVLAAIDRAAEAGGAR